MDLYGFWYTNCIHVQHITVLLSSGALVRKKDVFLCVLQRKLGNSGHGVLSALEERTPTVMILTQENLNVSHHRDGIVENMLRIHEILVRMRIPLPLTNEAFGSGSGSGFCYFRQWPSRRQQKFCIKCFFAYYGTFMKVHSHHFSKIKSHKEVTKL